MSWLNVPVKHQKWNKEVACIEVQDLGYSLSWSYVEIKQKHYIRTILYRLTRKVWSLRRNKYSNVFDSFFVAQSLPTISLHFLSWETLQAMSAHFLYPTIATKYKLHAIYIYANHTQPPNINQKSRRRKLDLYIWK